MIELNGTQISDNNINTKKNVKIYVDEKQLDSKVGELQDLETTNKSSIVNAINEIKNTTNTLQVDVNRIYSDFTIIPNTPTEQEFTYKKSNEDVIEKGVAMINKVKGNSVVWNQLINSGNGGSLAGVTFTKNGLAYVLNGTCTAEQNFEVCRDLQVIKGHKYCLASNSSVVSVTSWENPMVLNANKFFGDIATAMASGGTRIFIDLTNGTTYNNVVVLPVIYDLTQMFGAGNEPSTYEEFLHRKPKVADEYAYNEGTIVNNKVEKVVTTGRNLCPYLEQGTIDISNGREQPSTTRVRTPFIPISNKHSYCTMLNKWSMRNGCFYDRDKNFISLGHPSESTGVLNSSNIPVNAAFYRLVYSAQNTTDVVTPSYDVFMFAIGDTTIPTTKYEPYEEHTLDLSWVKEIKDIEGVKLFEDGMRSAGTAFDEAAKGRAIKRIGVMDMGKMRWYKRDDISPNMFASNDIAPNNKIGLCPIASINKTTTYDGTLVDGILYWMRNYIMIYNSKFTTIDDFVNFVSGVPIYYELAEPIVVEYDEKNLTYPVVAGGTEEAIASEPSTPMRASITYGSNTVATILSLMNRVNELERKIIN